MILALDVAYRADGARVAGVLFADWGDSQPLRELVLELPGPPADYVSGSFADRELSCLLQAIRSVPEPLQTLVVDGYVRLGAEQRPGLGHHLWSTLGIPVIGVAKSFFAGTPASAELRRGGSARPLYVTSAGLAPETALECIARMAGQHRLPTLLKRVDQLTKASAPQT